MESFEDDTGMETGMETEVEPLTTSLNRITPNEANATSLSPPQALDSPTSSRALFTPTQTAQPTSTSKHPTCSSNLASSSSKCATPQQLSSRVTKLLPIRRPVPRTEADLPAFMQALLTAKARPAPKPAAKSAAKSNKAKDHAFVWDEEKPKPTPTKQSADAKMELDSVPAPINDLFLRLGIGPSKGLLPTERVERGYVSRLKVTAPQVRDDSSEGEEGEEAQAARWAAEEEAMEVKARRKERR